MWNSWRRIIRGFLWHSPNEQESLVPVKSFDKVAVVKPAVAANLPPLPSEWTQLNDDDGTTFYASPNVVQYTHPSLNAPPFDLERTDYVMKHPAPDAPARSWILYLWLRDVKCTHSIMGVLCAISWCSLPHDIAFQRRIVWRIYLAVCNLFCALLFQVAGRNAISPGKECDQQCTLQIIPVQILVVSVPLAIFRCWLFC